jgi:hypothetical protein
MKMGKLSDDTAKRASSIIKAAAKALRELGLEDLDEYRALIEFGIKKLRLVHECAGCLARDYDMIAELMDEQIERHGTGDLEGVGSIMDTSRECMT